MDPNLWGPSAWYFMHSLTYSYPERPTDEDKKAARNFFSSLKQLLPCSVCKVNYDSHFADNNIENHLDSRDSLVHWLIDIHNRINMDSGKPILTYEQVLHQRPPMYANMKQLTMYVILLLLCLIILRTWSD